MENDQESNQNTTQLFNVIVKHGQFSRNNVLEYAKSKLSPKEKIVRIKDWIEIQSGIPSDQYEDVEECDADIVDSNDEFKSKKRKYDIFDDDFESVIDDAKKVMSSKNENISALPTPKNSNRNERNESNVVNNILKKEELNVFDNATMVEILRNLPESQKKVAENLIQKVLYLARVNALSAESDIILNRQNQPSSTTPKPKIVFPMAQTSLVDNNKCLKMKIPQLSDRETEMAGKIITQQHFESKDLRNKPVCQTPNPEPKSQLSKNGQTILSLPIDNTEAPILKLENIECISDDNDSKINLPIVIPKPQGPKLQNMKTGIEINSDITKSINLEYKSNLSIVLPVTQNSNSGVLKKNVDIPIVLVSCKSSMGNGLNLLGTDLSPVSSNLKNVEIIPNLRTTVHESQNKQNYQIRLKSHSLLVDPKRTEPISVENDSSVTSVTTILKNSKSEDVKEVSDSVIIISSSDDSESGDTERIDSIKLNPKPITSKSEDLIFESDLPTSNKIKITNIISTARALDKSNVKWMKIVSDVPIAISKQIIPNCKVELSHDILPVPMPSTESSDSDTKIDFQRLNLLKTATSQKAQTVSDLNIKSKISLDGNVDNPQFLLGIKLEPQNLILDDIQNLVESELLIKSEPPNSDTLNLPLPKKKRRRKRTHLEVQTRRKKDPFKNGIVYISCEWIGCRYGSNDYTEFQKHVKSHMHELLIKSYSSGDNVYVCLWDLCNFETPDSEEIKRHVNYHTYHTRIKTIGKSHLQTLPDCYKDSSLRNKIPKLQEDWICRWTGCTMKFFCIQEYFDHVKCHALGEKAVGKLLSCRWLGCCKTSVNIWYLFRHTRLHTLEKEYACHNCGNAFTNKQKLTDHCDRQVKRMEYKCGECSNIYGSLRLLRTHSVNHSRIHKCGQCDMAFSRPSILVNHIRHVHIDCKPFKCHLCSYGCVNKSDLKDHIYRHDKRGRKWIGGMEGRIYACHICERGYSRACALTKHLAKIHAYKVPGKFTRLKYDLSDDGVYRLSHNLYGETSVSTNEGNEDIKQRREIKQKCKKAKKSKSGDEISEKNTGDFTVVQCEKPSCNNVASFVVLRADQEEDSLKTILAMQGRPVDNDVQTNKDIIVKTPKISKKKLLNSRKRKKAVFKTKDIIKTKISKIETTTLPDNDKKPKNIKVKEEPKEYCEIPIVQVKKELEENHIEISIEDVDFQGNIVKREVVESHQFILT